jgi:hypothetical protein
MTQVVFLAAKLQTPLLLEGPAGSGKAEIVFWIEQGWLQASIACRGKRRPGLRWGLMGPNLLFHLGGGQGGIHHFMEHLSGPMTTWWKDLGNPEFTPELKEKISQGVLAEAGNHTINDLAEERDRLLLGLLALRTTEKY